MISGCFQLQLLAQILGRALDLATGQIVVEIDGHPGEDFLRLSRQATANQALSKPMATPGIRKLIHGLVNGSGLMILRKPSEIENAPPKAKIIRARSAWPNCQ